jgi:hypothetical protein
MNPIAILANILIALAVRLRVRLLVSKLVRGVKRSDIVVRYVLLITDIVGILLMYYSIYIGLSEAGLDQIP